MPNITIQNSENNYSSLAFLNKKSIEEIRLSLLNWFDLNGRHWTPCKLNSYGKLPKEDENLCIYSIFVAEVMLQQTQLKVVLPYWCEWMKTFPSLEDLAYADISKILLLWQGLGYYSRARRIHESSKILAKLIDINQSLDLPSWPKDINIWMKLPGIGKSTAGSILSSAFNLPEPLLDSNVKRIISRLFGLKKPVIKNTSQLWSLSNLLLDYESPRRFNQALMDLGATICTSRSPICNLCPLNPFCFAYNFGSPQDFPIKTRSRALPKVIIGIGLILNNHGQVLIDQRLDEGTMGGMWEFPGGKQEKGESIQITIARELYEELGIDVIVGENLIEFDHSYSHKELHFVVHFCELVSGEPKPLSSSQVKWVKIEELSKYPFPAANKKMIDALKKYLINK